jgi:hypothetical protein
VPAERQPAGGRDEGTRMDKTDSKKGFFGSLFDFSFHSFVFPKIVSFFYGLLMILMTVGALVAMVWPFFYPEWQENFDLPPWAMLIIVPIVYFIYLIAIRTTMEIAIVLFRIYENTDRLADQVEIQP